MDGGFAQGIGDVGAQLTLQMREGTTFGPIIATLRDVHGVVDLSGVTLFGGLRRRPADADYLVPFLIEVIDPPTAGRFRFTLLPEDLATTTASARARSHDVVRACYDLRTIDALGQVRTLLYGDVFIALGASRLQSAALVAPDGAVGALRLTGPGSVTVRLATAQGLSGPPGPPGPGVDPDALPLAPDVEVLPGDLLPVVPTGSFGYSPLAQALVRFDGVQWAALGGGGGSVPSGTYPDNALTNELGEVLVNDQGEVVVSG